MYTQKIGICCRLIIINMMKVTIFTLAIITVVLSLTFRHQGPLRLRKSIHVLNETERKSLFWCIKMLTVLPAPAPFRNRTYIPFAKLPKDNPSMNPQCVADILISSHSSSCEHTSFYFAHYHRHLMIHSEIWLNFVHQTLSGGQKRLLELYPAELYYSHSKEWDEVFYEYAASGAADIPIISLHYWNPTNYKNKLDIMVPPELASPKEYPNKKLEAVDRLFQAVLGHWPWQINVRTRLVSPDYKWNQVQFQAQMENLQVFDRPGDVKQYTVDELNILNQKLTPRRQPKGQNFSDFLKAYTQFRDPLKKEGPSFYSSSRKRFRDYFHTVGKNITLPFSAIPEQQLYVLFGAQVQYQSKGKFLKISNQYVSQHQRKGLKLNHTAVNNYNTFLPHYSLAYALFNTKTITSFKDYLKKPEGFEKSHDQMHDERGFFLRDPLYSIVTPFFFNYHSWIDMELQIKIRMSNHQDKISNQSHHFNILKDFLENGEKGQQSFRLKMLLDDEIKPEYRNQTKSIISAQLNKFYALISANNQSIFPTMLDQTKVGSQLVFEWTNHFIQEKLEKNETVGEAFIAAFIMRDYMLTPTSLRSTKDLGELYRNTFVKNNGGRFKGLIDVANFPFDYDYQVYNGQAQINPRLDGSGSNLARYLRDMRKEVQDAQ